MRHSVHLAIPFAWALVCLVAGAADPTGDELIARLKDVDPKTRRLAAAAIGRSKLESAIPPLAAALGDPNPGVRIAAAQALRRIGPQSFAAQVAALSKLSADDKRRVLEGLIDLAPKAAESNVSAESLGELKKLLADRDTDVRIHATVLLGAIGAPAKEMLPSLLAQLVDPARTPYLRAGRIPSSVSDATAQAILKIDPQAQESMAKAAMPALLKLLESADGSKADSAAQVIEKLGPHGRGAEAALLAALDRARTYEGYAIRSALFKIGDTYAKQLERTLRDPDAPVRSRTDALRALNGAPPSYDAKIATLLALALADDEPTLRATAVDICWMSASRARPVLKDLVRLLGDRGLDDAIESIRIGSGDTLIQAIRRAGPDAIEPLKVVVANRRISPSTRARAARALGLFGRVARPALDALEAAMESDHPALEAQAAAAFLFAGGDVAKARPAFERAIRSRSPTVQAEVLHLASEVGERLASLAPSAVALLDSEEREVRIAAAHAVCRFGPSIKVPVKTLAARMAAGDGREKYQMAQALASLEHRAADAIPDLIRRLDDLGNSFPVPALTSLEKIGPEAKAAVPKLIGILQGGTKTRFHASQVLDVLAAIGPGAKDATSVLAARLKDPKDDQRPKVLRALGCIGPDAKAALPEIEARVDDEDPIVSAWARFAVLRITGTREPHTRVLRELWEDQRDLRSPGGGFRYGTDFPDLCLRLGTDAAAFRDLLLADFLDPRIGVGTQAAIARSLGAMPREADHIVPKVVAAIDRYPRDAFGKDYLTNMVTVLANMGPAAKSALPRLRQLAEECEYDAVAVAAERAVRRIEGRTP
jgi:HEAT repeat protein